MAHAALDIPDAPFYVVEAKGVLGTVRIERRHLFRSRRHAARQYQRWQRALTSGRVLFIEAKEQDVT